MFQNRSDILKDNELDIETETLQTDIQRFLAIIGFCLMAIFALVQAIPVTSHEQKTMLEDPKAKLEAQEQTIAKLKEENRRLKQQIQTLMKHSKITDELKEKLQRAQEIIQAQAKKIDELTKEKIHRKIEIDKLKAILADREEKIRKLKQQKQVINNILKKVRKELKVPESETTSKPSEEKKGIYVAFESDKVFLDLLKKGKIKLMIQLMDIDKGFIVIPEERKISFRYGSIVGSGYDLWEAREDIIPEQILSSFRSWTSLAHGRKMFIVGLSPEISSQIRNRAVKSGSFIIGQDGKVTYRP